MAKKALNEKKAIVSEEKITYCAFDLHCDNAVLVVMNEDKKIIVRKRLAMDLKTILAELEPFRRNHAGVAVESTYNWYWLADGLMADSYTTLLVHTAAMGESQKKTTGDFDDAVRICEKMRDKSLPVGFICDRAVREIRDLLRRRLRFVRYRSSLKAALSCVIARQLGVRMGADKIMHLSADELTDRLGEVTGFEAQRIVRCILNMDTEIAEIEKFVLARCKLSRDFHILKTIPGVGDILAMTIMLEVCTIRRFRTAGKFASYCRLVCAIRTSNKKLKGKGNRRNGNRYLSWAFHEAAVTAARYNPTIGAFFCRKQAGKRERRPIAVASTGAKLAKAAFYMIRDQQEFDVTRSF